jgi:type IX secretion system PorP/SprF family membrane protein
MNRFYLTIAIFCLTCASTVKGQDPHFSQYFSSPLTLNPAMAGYFKGDQRIAANYRQQWWGVGDPFTTSTISFDTKLKQGTIPEYDVFSMGIVGLYDQSLNGAFKSINVSGVVAYSKALDEEGVDNIGAGFQFTYASRAINITDLNFATQFNGSGFDTNLPSYETFGSARKNYFDISTGVLYTHKTESNEFYFGTSFYHVTTPNTSFLKDQKFRLPLRFTFHSAARLKVDDNGNELFLSGIYMQQAGAADRNIGVAYGYAASEDTKIYLGGWYRIKDAIVPYFGLSKGGFELGATYDIVNSSLKKYNNKNGSFELSLKALINGPVNYYTNYKGGKIF